MMAICTANAQELTDSLHISPNDSATVLPLLLEDAKQDSAKAKKETNTTVSSFKPNPKTSLILSFALPGAGQIYNRKYWKVPIVYLGFGALTYAIIYNNKKYQDYRKAYIAIADTVSTNEYIWHEKIPSGMTVETIDKAWFQSALDNKRLQFRRNRDLSIIGTVLFYTLTVLDAYVDAQLFDFDISPDLSLRVEPVLTNPTLINLTPPTFGVSCQLTF